jgi:hypothetical protein
MTLEDKAGILFINGAVPYGGTIDQAWFPRVDVKVEVGHRYTVAAMGQLADKDIHPRLIFVEDSLNGLPIGPNYTVGNGNRAQITYTLLRSK